MIGIDLQFNVRGVQGDPLTAIAALDTHSEFQRLVRKVGEATARAIEDEVGLKEGSVTYAGSRIGERI